ncbi:DoxX family protein [Solimonas terrae]|uniref:DoxX family protein n=1 Tax=Solimonas terrae TaxID=1396819 RepID=A0A6M2BT54_9GAMM|nr:DoxX family protein [Solimonas terrae]NGY05147.1 DoxX family protein [Solimonas terrae]
MDKIFDSVKPYSDLLGRILIAVLFVIAGWGKISAYAGTQQYMAAMGVPGGLLPLVIALELGGGIAIVLGLFTRPVALLLAGFSIITAVLFHGAADHVNQIMFMKNLAIAGGFLFLVGHGAGRFSLDQLRRTA